MSHNTVSITNEEIAGVAQQLGAALEQHKQKLVTAESCTGGWVGSVVTSVPGSSRWYDRGFITYSNTSKREMLGVSAELIARYGAVSEQTARAMVEGALDKSQAQFALSITGIAGPGGGSEEKPVGLVWFAWSSKSRETRSRSCQFGGDRANVRKHAVHHALQGMLDYIDSL